MRRRRPTASKALALLSLLVAAGATLTLRGHLARLEARAATPAGAEPVVVAAADLPRGTRLTAAALRLERIPADYREPGALSSIDGAIGLTLASDVAAGESITRSRLSGGGPLAALIPPTLRAVAITAPLPPGTLVPGDRVDVLATFAARRYADTVATAAEVLRVVPGPDPGAATLLLLVTPETAETLAGAATFAQLSVAVVPAPWPPRALQ